MVSRSFAGLWGGGVKFLSFFGFRLRASGFLALFADLGFRVQDLGLSGFSFSASELPCAIWASKFS